MIYHKLVKCSRIVNLTKAVNGLDKHFKVVKQQKEEKRKFSEMVRVAAFGVRAKVNMEDLAKAYAQWQSGITPTAITNKAKVLDTPMRLVQFAIDMWTVCKKCG